MIHTVIWFLTIGKVSRHSALHYEDYLVGLFSHSIISEYVCTYMSRMRRQQTCPLYIVLLTSEFGRQLQVAVADLGEGPLFLDQTEARRADLNTFWGDHPPPPFRYLRIWMTGHPPYLKVWIRH